MANKELTIGEVEDMKAKLGTTVAEAIQAFEEETGMRISWINMVREKDRDSGSEKDCCPVFENDRGKIVSVNIDMDMEI